MASRHLEGTARNLPPFALDPFGARTCFAISRQELRIIGGTKTKVGTTQDMPKAVMATLTSRTRGQALSS